MKKVLMFALFAAMTATGVFAQTAKDLFVSRENNLGQGMSGAKIAVQLKRGSGAARLVSPDTAFRTGDKIRLLFDLNFNGYIAVVNQGTSGSLQLIFPYQGQSDSVSSSALIKIPALETDWIEFDEKKGVERMTVIFSKSRLPEVQQAIDSISSASSTASSTSGGSTGGVAAAADEAAIFAALNSKAIGKKLKTATTKDLRISRESDANYYVTNEADASGLVSVRLELAHN